ncbi:MAG: hypothetical protein MK008_02585 [Bdellovibrionales bacterium]|nr:hypothetical protein [Bdellovibrionales bacterium]
MSSLRQFLLLYLFFNTACVSIDIPKNELRKSSNYSFVQPNEDDFKVADSKELDHLWVHKENGNSISILSDCSTSYDPSLQQLKNGITSGINNLQTKSSNYKTYNKRKALFTHIQGDVDGVMSEFDLVIFKKNGCVYTLTHVATKNSYSITKDSFNKFVSNFKVD